ncbi:UPF0149 family protein [Pseudomonas sp. MAFF212428]|uniref:UPF0149 family protein n=1 Tax=Pseudomonas brassicae TaxID=2708063 RepID=A0A6B3NZE6_9PSED|nr:UPF0149 family protein [Pseudomonas brassicae]NER60850.1 UPF0149 family protein [Pseudomonas brassicae]NER64854.1 UPF0149 family protein [Pseudomonas brassicae]
MHTLSATEVEFIDDILLQYGDDHSVLNTSELDGYLTALVSGPRPVDIAEWFPGIFGGQQPAWQSPAQCKQFIELSTRHLNGLAEQFCPRFEQTEHNGQPLTLAEEWCFGYLRGVGLANWPALPAAQQAALDVIASCAEQDNFDLPADLDVVLHRQRVAAIEPAAQALRSYWVAQR